MGWGDEIMVTGEARRMQRSDPRPVLVVDRRERPRWSPLWQGNRRIVNPARQRDEGAAHQVLMNGPGCRPYVDYARTTHERWAYTAWRASPGELPMIALRPRQDVIIVEPTIKPNASPNKQWPRGHWQRLVDLLRPIARVAQIGPSGTAWLDGAERWETASFLSALEKLTTCRLAVLHEGGLHHAAAALDTPAVVIFGGHCSPANTGYDQHRNIFNGTPETMGWRVPNAAARACMVRIVPEEIAEHVKDITA